MKYKDIKDFWERCDKHPDHQNGMISYSMIERRLREEIEELRQYIEQRLEKPKKTYAEVDLADAYQKGWDDAMLRKSLEEK